MVVPFKALFTPKFTITSFSAFVSRGHYQERVLALPTRTIHQRYTTLALSLGRMHNFVYLKILAISVVFFCIALFTEVGRRLYGGLLVDVHGILCAVLTPMPLIHSTSPNIVYQS
jgi:hypothetical protein